MKIHSPDIVHKSDIGGVHLGLASEQAVREATTDVFCASTVRKPGRAHSRCVTIHPMIVRPRARELIAGIADDPTFGPIVVFGTGGTAVEVIDDKAIGLPPLDMKLAQDLIARTRVSRLLKAYRDVPAADGPAVAAVLVKLAQLAADLPEVREVDLIRFLLTKLGSLSSMRALLLSRSFGHIRADLAIRASPSARTPRNGKGVPDSKMAAIFSCGPSGRTTKSCIRPFLSRVSQQDLQLRFFAPVKQFDHVFIARFTQLDYSRAMAFVAVDEASGEMSGVGRLHANSNYDTAEFAVLVRSDLKGRGPRLAPNADDDRIRPQRGIEDYRRTGAQRKHHDAADVRGAELRHHDRSGRTKRQYGPAFAGREDRVD